MRIWSDWDALVGRAQLSASRSLALINNPLTQPDHPYAGTLVKSGEAGRTLIRPCWMPFLNILTRKEPPAIRSLFLFITVTKA